MKGLLFEGLDLSSARGKSRPWVALTSVALHAMAFAAVVMVPMVVTNDVPVAAGTPPVPIYEIQRVRVAPAPPARRVREEARQPATSAAPARSVEMPIEIPDRLPDPEPPGTPVDTPVGPFVLGAGCPDCAPAPPGLPAGGSASGVTDGTGTGPLIVRPGGDIQLPRKLKHVSPEYPPLAITAHVGGTVILECIIDVQGNVASVRLLRGHPLLNEAAVEAVRKWKYVPTKLNGIPVAVEMTVTVHFTPR